MRQRAARSTAGVSNSLTITIGKPGLALGAVALSGSLHAADDAKPGELSGKQIEEVVVTGIRGSLQRSLDIKQQAIGVIDAISAEDIGKFPDSNLASALQRIPGVSISRGTTSMGGVPTSTGDASAITVRGFGPSFNETLIDGRVAASISGFGNTLSRGFDFSSLGADFVKEVHILKTPDATLSSGAIGASINVIYPQPFDRPGMRLAGSASASYSPDAGEESPNAGLLFSNTFADDTFGILASAVYSEHAVRGNHVNVQGWEGVQLAPSQLNQSVIRNNETGLNVAWDVSDRFTAELDVARSTSKLNPGGELSSIDADVGYGPSGPGGTNGVDIGVAGIGSDSLWQAYAGYGPASNNPGGVALPGSLFTRTIGTSNFIRGFSNNGNLPPQLLVYDPFAVLAYLQSLGNPQTQAIPGANADCCNPSFDGTFELALTAGSVQKIRERTYAPFLSLAQEAQIAAMPLRMNFGVRFETTDLSSAGLGQNPVALTVQSSDRTAFLVSYGPIQTITEKNRYRYLLPSMDLNLSVTDALKLRFDASRTLTRPALHAGRSHEAVQPFPTKHPLSRRCAVEE